MHDSTGEILRHHRLKAGLRLIDVLKILQEKYNIDISIASVQRLEANKRELTLIEAIALSNIYKVDFDEYKKSIEHRLFKQMVNN